MYFLSVASKKKLKLLIIQFTKENLQLRHKDTVFDFTVHYLDLWDWMKALINDPKLFPHFQLDPVQLFKYDGSNFRRFVNDPWTANYWWELQVLICFFIYICILIENLQSTLPPDGRLFGYIIYADKSRLSSFGSIQAYPVVARPANLVTEIRNSNGIGGGRIVGWLPIVCFLNYFHISNLQFKY